MAWRWTHPRVFAVGDCAAFTPALPKAGVFAVRMGPVLVTQLRAALRSDQGAGTAPAYVPQRRYLVLLATGTYLTFFFQGSQQELIYTGSYAPLQGQRV